MKITYEPGDVVFIEDNDLAGDVTDTNVKLIKKVSDTKWQAEVFNEHRTPRYKSGTKGIVDEEWFWDRRYE
jgi:hypothetical protein